MHCLRARITSPSHIASPDLRLKGRAPTGPQTAVATAEATFRKKQGGLKRWEVSGAIKLCGRRSRVNQYDAIIDKFFNLPVIALTSSESISDHIVMQEVRIDGTIAKPLNVEELIGTIQQLIVPGDVRGR
jgi:CheY-like chemotaxis protein